MISPSETGPPGMWAESAIKKVPFEEANIEGACTKGNVFAFRG